MFRRKRLIDRSLGRLLIIFNDCTCCLMKLLTTLCPGRSIVRRTSWRWRDGSEGCVVTGLMVFRIP
ncbi:hypothetical protein Gohar_019673 [Gossypium harknessii]|uniref:Uncharacterized protein n=1 Tax=Gossypium harknessii TaxID=34285 RepID=A0A7J9IC22_9ROSI|nr:hypothetical protein [Gossypium harknessii]